MYTMALVFFLLACTLQISPAQGGPPVDPQCPIACRCTLYQKDQNGTRPYNGLGQLYGLDINCPDRGDGMALVESLPEEINALLRAINVPLAGLEIQHTTLTRVPKEICNLAGLQFLWLRHNQLKALPNNCISRLAALECLTADYNRITDLQDGLFDGLVHLKCLVFFHNKIETIGDRVFSNPADLPSLQLIDLSYNRLTSLEPWPFIRAMASPGMLVVQIFGNRISSFTNTANWTYKCDMKNINLALNLRNNSITHFAAFADTYFTELRDLNCFLLNFYSNQFALGDNPFECDCLDYYVRSQNVDYPFVTGIDIPVHEWGNFCKSSFVSNMTTNGTPVEAFACNVTDRCPAQCRCVSQPSNSTFHVLCAGRELTELPYDLPPANIPHTVLMPTNLPKYKLDFSDNNIQILEKKLYFDNTAILDVHSSQVKNISEEALGALQDVDRIYLHDNLLRTLPRYVQTINFSFTSLSLYNNPLDCSCDQSWLKAWLTSIHDRLVKSDEILCSTPPRLRGKIIWSVNDTDFCHEPGPDPLDHKILTLALSLSIIPFISLVFLLVVFRFRVQAYKTLHIHPFDRDECDGEDMAYDVLVVYSRQDNHFAAVLLEFLESHGFKVVFHQRDFPPNELIVTSIHVAICTSKRVLCVVTQSFVESPYCMHEFETAYNRNVAMKRRRLIVLKHEEFVVDAETSVEESEGDEILLVAPAAALLEAGVHTESDSNMSSLSMLREFVTHRTYINLSLEMWRDVLLYALPVQKIKPTSTGPDADANAEIDDEENMMSVEA